MRNLYIVGIGGAAKEIVQLIEQINELKPSYHISGFVDIKVNSDKIKLLGKSYDLFAEENFLRNKGGESIVIAHGSASIRASIYSKYAELNFPSIVHPNVDLHESVRIGNGNIIKMGCLITTDTIIGDNNYINRGAQIGHDVSIGDNNVFNPGAIISGGVQIGDANNFGANATVLQYLSLGNDNTLGAGAVLTTNASNGQLLLGVPAKQQSSV